MADKVSLRLMTWAAAEEAFAERMKAFRDEVFELFGERPPSGEPTAAVHRRYKDDCLRIFARVWTRKWKKGLRSIEKGLLPQKHAQHYGAVRTRNDRGGQYGKSKPKRAKKDKPKGKRGRPIKYKLAERRGHHAYKRGVRRGAAKIY